MTINTKNMIADILNNGTDKEKDLFLNWIGSITEALENEKVRKEVKLLPIGREGIIDDTRNPRIWVNGVETELDLSKPKVNNDHLSWNELYGKMIEDKEEKDGDFIRGYAEDGTPIKLYYVKTTTKENQNGQIH